MDVTGHSHGTFCFVELNTPDMQVGKRFYGELLGWKPFDVASAQGSYSLMQLDGKDVAGMHRTAQEASSWLSYVSVESTDGTAERAQELGAVLIAPPFDVPGIARIAALRDPAGATLSLWEARGYTGVQLANQLGAMTWMELLARDVSVARRFYNELFGWTATESRIPSVPYTIFKLGNRSVGGLLQIGKDWGPVPPRWQVFFAVDDCDSGTARARELGGSVDYGPADVPGEGRLAVLRDPLGAVFVIMKFARAA